MPYIETLDDIIEELADKLGVYGAHNDQCSDKHRCRVCWTSDMRYRLQQGMINQEKLEH